MGEWVRISFAQMLERARAVGQALLDLELSAERPVAILSDNDLEHLTLAIGAMWAGVPFAPVSPAYSLLSQDHGKLRHIFDTVTPGLVFASGPAFGKAIAAVAPADTTVVLTEGTLDGRATRSFASLLATAAGADAGRRPRRDRPRHDRQVSLHLGFDEGPEGRHQHPPHDVREPADGAADDGLPGR